MKFKKIMIFSVFLSFNDKKRLIFLIQIVKFIFK
jgi:hypothetical protein